MGLRYLMMNAIMRASLKPALLASSYILLAWLTLRFLWLTGEHISVVWPCAGLAVAALLWGGRPYLTGIWLGELLTSLLVLDNPLWLAVWGASGCAVQALLVQGLVRRTVHCQAGLSHPQHFLGLCLAAALGVVPTVTWGVLGLWLAGVVPEHGWALTWLTWWQGDTLGIILLTPLLLIWRERLSGQPLPLARRLELLLLVGLLLLAGQVVFFGWLHPSLGWLVQSYTMFLFVSWAALRFGRHGASLTIVLIAVQALLGMGQPGTALGQSAEPVPMMSYWLFVLVLSILGMSLGLSIHQRRLLQAQASATAAQLQALTASVPGVVFQFERNEANDWRFVFLSEGVEHLFGVSAEQGLQDAGTLVRLIDPADQPAHHASVERSARDLMPWQHESRIQSTSGQHKWVQGHALPVRQPDGSVLWSGILSDVTAQHLLQDRLRLAASVFDHAQESVMITNAQRCIVDVNQAFCRTSGHSRNEVLGQNPRLLASDRQGPEFYARMWQTIDSQGFWTGELWNRHKSGIDYAVLLHIAEVRNAQQQLTHYIGLASEITRMKQQHQEIEHHAYFDALTGVPNRLLLADRLSQAMGQARREQSLLAVCYLDLDGFKLINDQYGHNIGDAVLVEVVLRIQRNIRGAYTLARVGGDEFVLLLPGLQYQQEFVHMLERLLQEVAAPIDLTELDRQHSVGVSIGVSVFPHLAEDAASLMEQADRAMYGAKRAGKQCWQLYDADNLADESRWPVSEMGAS